MRADLFPRTALLGSLVPAVGLALALSLGCGQQPAETETPGGAREGAQEPKAAVEARSSVDRAVATTGDVITYTVTVDYDPAYEVDVPEPGADIAGFRIIDLGREEREAGGRVVEERWYQLRADLVGSYVLPPVTVTYSRAEPLGEGPSEPEQGGAEEGGAEESASGDVGTVQSVQTSAIFVEVESVLPGEGEEAATDIRDIKPLQEIPSTVPWPWILGGAGALLLLGLAFWLWRRRPEKLEPPEPAHVRAFRELDALRGTDFQDPEAVRRFHFRISEVLRAYVEGRYRLNATDLTSEEINAALPGLPVPEAQRREIAAFLWQTDRVKFADHTPDEEEIRVTYDQALTFVEKTRPAEEPAAEGPPAGGGADGGAPREEAA